MYADISFEEACFKAQNNWYAFVTYRKQIRDLMRQNGNALSDVYEKLYKEDQYLQKIADTVFPLEYPSCQKLRDIVRKTFCTPDDRMGKIGDPICHLYNSILCEIEFVKCGEAKTTNRMIELQEITEKRTDSDKNYILILQNEIDRIEYILKSLPESGDMDFAKIELEFFSN